MISKPAYYRIIKEFFFLTEDKNISPNNEFVLKIKPFIPFRYPVFSLYIKFNCSGNYIHAIHFNDIQNGILYYVNLECENFIGTKEVLLNIQLPENVGSSIRVVYKSSEDSYYEVGMLEKKDSLWILTYGINDINILNNCQSSINESQYFLVGGPPKSGTTWVKLILNNHPEVICVGEGGFYHHYRDFLDIIKRDLRRDYVDWFFPVRNENFEYLFLIKSLCMSYFEHYKSLWPSVKAVGDKSPSNALYYNEILDSFPNVKLIHITRNPLDVVVSRIFHEWNLYRTGKRSLSILDEKQYNEIDHWIKYEKGFFRNMDLITFIIEEWIEYNKQAIDLVERGKENVIILKYEDLQNNFENEVKRLFSFLNLNLNDYLLSYISNNTSFEKLSGRKKGQEYKTSFYRKGIVGDWKNYLEFNLVKPILNNFKDYLYYLGYYYEM